LYCVTIPSTLNLPDATSKFSRFLMFTAVDLGPEA
jgi:hypothetical protein